MFCVKGNYTDATINSERRLSTDSTSHYSSSTLHPVSDADDENTIRRSASLQLDQNLSLLSVAINSAQDSRVREPKDHSKRASRATVGEVSCRTLSPRRPRSTTPMSAFRPAPPRDKRLDECLEECDILIRGGSVRDTTDRMALSSFLGNMGFSPGNYDDSVAARSFVATNLIKHTLPRDDAKPTESKRKLTGTDSLRQSGEWPAIPSFLLPPPPPSLEPLPQTILQMPLQNPLQKPMVLPLQLTAPLSAAFLQNALPSRQAEQTSDRERFQSAAVGDREARSFWPNVVSAANVSRSNNHPSYV